MTSINAGDLVTGKPGNGYSITTERMTRGIVTEVSGGQIKVNVLEHLDGGLGAHWVDPDKFTVIGHAKPFNRGEVLKLLRNGCKKAISDYDLRGANLRGADLKGADLKGANLDFSCWPLWCGSLKVKTDKRLAVQLAYHLCSMQCDDAEYTEMRNSILAFANQFHRSECPRLTPTEASDNAAE